MRPSSGGSSRLMQRNSVLLPLPLGPITQTTPPRSTDRSTPRSTCSLPKLLWTPSSRSIYLDRGGAPHRKLLARNQIVHETGKRDRDDHEQERTKHQGRAV